MQITSNLIDKYTIKPLSQNNEVPNTQTVPVKTAEENVLPASGVNGIAQVNTNLPIGYTKIGEISVPGLEQKASLYKLANGQKVVIQPKKNGPTFVRTSFAVGALNEPDEKRGISHFIEHNLFNGSKNLKTGEYDSKVQKLGGYTNAYTSFGETQYYLSLENLQDNSLEEAIKLNAEQTQFPTFPDEPLQREKEPVKSEIDMCSDNATNKAYTIMLKNMFGLQSSSEDIVIGTKNNINNMTREDLFDYYNTWYTPDNAVTVITGDVDEKEAIELVSKYYNKKNDYSQTQKRQFPNLVPANKPSRTDIKQKNDPNATVLIGFPFDANAPKEDYYRLSVLFSLLESNSSELSKRLDKYGITLPFNIDGLSSDPNAAKVISASYSVPEEQTEEILKITYEELAKLAVNPPTQEDMDRIVNSQITSLKTNEYSAEISASLLNMVKTNSLDYYSACEKALKSLTPNDISNLAKKYLDLNKASICVAHPESSSDADIMTNYQNANAKTNSVSFGKAIDLDSKLAGYTSGVKQYKLANNMQIATVPTEGTPESHIVMNFQSDINPTVSRAATSVLIELLNRGNALSDKIDYQNALGDLQASAGFSATQDGICVVASCVSENTDETLKLVKQTLLNPNFTQEEFDRAKEIVKIGLEHGTKSAYDKLYETLSPNNKKYANVQTQLQELDKLTLDDVKRLYFGILNNSQVLSTITYPEDKNINQSTLTELAKDFPSFRQFVPNKDANYSVYVPNTQEKYLTDTEENAQADVVQSYTYKYSENVEDEAKIMLLNGILGQGMSSRLFQDLRNNEKIAYHVASHIGNDYDQGVINLEIQTSTESDEASSENITKALNAFKRNVERLKTENVTQEELDAAKTVLKTDTLADLEGSDSKATLVASDIDSAYGFDYETELFKAIDKITVEDIKAAANYVFANPPINSIVASKKTLEELKLQ